MCVVPHGEGDVVVYQGLLHSGVRAHLREIRAVQIIAIFSAPGHVKHWIRAFIIHFDRSDQLNGRVLC